MSKEQTYLVSHVVLKILAGKLKVALAPDKVLANLNPLNYIVRPGISVPVNIIEVYGKNVILINEKFMDALETVFNLSPVSVFDKKIVLLETFKKGDFPEDEFPIVACKPHGEPNNTIYKVSIGNKSCIFKNKTNDTLYAPLDKFITLSQRHLDPNKGALVILAPQLRVELMSDYITLTTEHNRIVALIVLKGKTFECASLPIANEFILEPWSLIAYEDENHNPFYAQNLSDQDLSLNIIGLLDISASFERC